MESFKKTLTFKLKAERIVILRNIKLTLVFIFHELPLYPSVLFWFLPCWSWQSCPHLPLSMSLFKRKSLHFSKLLALEDEKEGATYTKCTCFTFHFVIMSVTEGGA